MTPLNCILGCTELAIDQIQSELRNEAQRSPHKTEELVSNLKAVLSSGKILHLFNLNQIQRMKIRKQEFSADESVTACPQFYVEEVITPFAQKIKSMKIKVLQCVQIEQGLLLKADWQKFKLVVFNIAQNAVKYNSYKGTIAMVSRLSFVQQSINSPKVVTLVTDIIDTGNGIETNRQNLLFKPFRELRKMQDLDLVKDRSIGLGLACSKDIINALGGDVSLIASTKGLTVFRVTMPVKVTDERAEDDDYVRAQV